MLPVKLVQKLILKLRDIDFMNNFDFN